MFGKNLVRTPRHFADEPQESLVVTSIFTTIQGEGPFAGIPAHFVRLSGCNLQCSFCDTYFDSGTTMSFEEIFEGMQSSNQKRSSYDRQRPQPGLVVITGGEPFLHRDLGKFVTFLQMRHYSVQIESNGNFYPRIPDDCTLVISPKVNERTDDFIKMHPDALRRADALKFVISASMPGYQDVPSWALDWLDLVGKRRAIFLSPMNCYLRAPQKPTAESTPEQRSALEAVSFWQDGLLDQIRNRENHEHAAFLVMKYGLRLSLQLHLYASMP